MKKWLTERFLPMWAKETVLRENRELQEENRRLFQKLREKDAYIKGLHKGIHKARGKFNLPPGREEK